MIQSPLNYTGGKFKLLPQILPLFPQNINVLDIAERDEIEIYMEQDKIVLQKFEPACIFCGSARELMTYRGKNVCQDCVKKMADY